MIIIYLVENIVNCKKYIGQTSKTLNRRRSNHFAEAKMKRCKSAFYNALRKYDRESFSWKIIKDDISDNDADYYERFYIREYNSLVPNGYNIESGGCLHKKLSEETKKKISIANKGKLTGRRHSEESKKRMSLSKTGVKRSPFSDEWKTNIGLGQSGEKHHMWGKKHSEETLKKISNSLSGEKHPLFGVECSDDRKINISKGHAKSNLSKVNSTGFKGVCWNKKNKKWTASINENENGNRKYLGSFKDKVEAAKAYDNALTDKFGKDNCVTNKDLGLY